MKRLGFVVLLAAACSSNNPPTKTVDFDLDTDLTAGSGAFWSMPFPSDVRVTGSGAPDVAGYPNPLGSPLVASLLSDVGEHHGYPVMSTAYFRFTDAVPARSGSDVITDGSVVLLDIDPASSEQGSAYPVIAVTLASDPYTAKNLVAIAPRPGIVLEASTQYAVVIRTAFAPGFTPAPAFADLAAGRTPSGARGSAAVIAFANLWPALDHAGIPSTDVLAATTFTTADEVARVRARSEAIRTANPVTIDPSSLVLDLGGSDGSGSAGSGSGSGSAGSGYDGFCHLTGTVVMPQFQVGTPPYDTQGAFVLDGSDVPQVQTTVAIPFSITLPKMAMPSTGFALYQFFHGSGGHSTDIVTLGPSPDPSDDPIPGYGPGYVVALHHIAAAASALPLNPERVPGASDYEYLNFNNLASFPYTFQQGAFEQRLFLDALLKLHIPASALAGCDGISTTTSDASGAYYFFDPAKVVGGGQSMGGMYTNIIGAIEPRYGALVPTGAGGFWNLMILETQILPGGATGLVASLFDAPAENLSFVHPALNVLALAWDTAEPIAYMNRIGERPLPGFSARDVYEPVGQGDSYFATDVYDAAALSYGHNEGGTEIWPAMQSALALEHLDGILPYPIKANRNGHTRAVIQYTGDGIIDPHYIYRQLPAVKFQYGCFLESYLATGVATIYAPGSNVAVTDPCPTP